VEQTPVLANHSVNVSENGQLAAIKAGDDVLVDLGNGKNAASQIFWPRVLERDAAGNSKPAVYKFTFTFLDGSEKKVYKPMLFVPSLKVGERLVRAI
jgi:hypothetical protein